MMKAICIFGTFKSIRPAKLQLSCLRSGFYGVFLHVLWLLQQHNGGGQKLLLQHPPCLPFYCRLLLCLLSHLHHSTVSPTANTTRFSIKDTNVSCEFPMSLYLSCLTHMLTHSMGSAARVAVTTGGSTVVNYSMIVFTGWDYGCLGDRATKLKQKNIHYRLQVRRDESRLT